MDGAGGRRHLVVITSYSIHYTKLYEPCGIADKGVTSLEAEMDGAPPMADVEDAVVRGFETVFG